MGPLWTLFLSGGLYLSGIWKCLGHITLVTYHREKIDSWFIVVIVGNPKNITTRNPCRIFKVLVMHHSVKQTKMGTKCFNENTCSCKKTKTTKKDYANKRKTTRWCCKCELWCCFQVALNLYVNEATHFSINERFLIAVIMIIGC